MGGSSDDATGSVAGSLGSNDCEGALVPPQLLVEIIDALLIAIGAEGSSEDLPPIRKSASPSMHEPLDEFDFISVPRLGTPRGSHTLASAATTLVAPDPDPSTSPLSPGMRSVQCLGVFQPIQSPEEISRICSMPLPALKDLRLEIFPQTAPLLLTAHWPQLTKLELTIASPLDDDNISMDDEYTCLRELRGASWPLRELNLDITSAPYHADILPVCDMLYGFNSTLRRLQIEISNCEGMEVARRVAGVPLPELESLYFSACEPATPGIPSAFASARWPCLQRLEIEGMLFKDADEAEALASTEWWRTLKALKMAASWELQSDTLSPLLRGLQAGQLEKLEIRFEQYSVLAAFQGVCLPRLQVLALTDLGGSTATAPVSVDGALSALFQSDLPALQILSIEFQPNSSPAGCGGADPQEEYAWVQAPPKDASTTFPELKLLRMDNVRVGAHPLVYLKENFARRSSRCTMFLHDCEVGVEVAMAEPHRRLISALGLSQEVLNEELEAFGALEAYWYWNTLPDREFKRIAAVAVFRQLRQDVVMAMRVGDTVGGGDDDEGRISLELAREQLASVSKVIEEDRDLRALIGNEALDDVKALVLDQDAAAASSSGEDDQHHHHHHHRHHHHLLLPLDRP